MLEKEASCGYLRANVPLGSGGLGDMPTHPVHCRVKVLSCGDLERPVTETYLSLC